MAALAEYSNVYNTALILMDQKGYRLWYDRKKELYCAEKDGWDFMAESPLSLLGIVAIFEQKSPSTYREYWWKEEGKDIYQNLPEQAPEYKPIYAK